MARQQARRRRRERIAGGILAGLGVVVLIVALIALRHPNRNATSPGTITRTVTSLPQSSSSATHSPSRAPSTPATHSSSSAHGLAGALPLVVLNNTSTPNLATQAADRFRGGGWTVSSVEENYSNNIISTAAYYDPSVSNAQDVAKALQQQFPAIKRVVPKFSPLPDGPIVVILTTDYSSG